MAPLGSVSRELVLCHITQRSQSTLLLKEVLATQGRTAKETKIFSIAVQVVLLHIIFNIAIIVSIKVLQRDDSEKFTML